MDIMNPNSTGTSEFYGEIEEIEDEVESRFNLFKNFDIIPNPPDDHRFKKDSSRVLLESPLGQKIEQEWNLLKKNLPNSIFVRVYESRVDLMRIAMIGPPHTPYHHGLFFFDIFFPRNYPSYPPKLYYHSYGLDLNPNLRHGGKVCLSMLARRYERIIREWYACYPQKWNKHSSILHVLYAIQGLFMCAKPYSTEESNKKAFELTCGIVIQVLREPPMDFEDFVKGYFRKRAHPILLKFRKEFDGDKDQLRIIELFTNLYRVLEKNGTYCMHHLCFLKSIKGNTEEESIIMGYFMKTAKALKYQADS
ncbi:probable ubiquitin-conjugating enzyme E2 25 [Olea europaea var. sylvestris]|uniref:probable ubiquitin-conjugating enzyme E2 25 n=1 Tax=Olea europaea var. sylvestris TaxID=158386 RepID=UPI000C1D598F|nr:probable ubiquitin-conjugating enzyme E2 25 [Olea europaea var. sylvestris]